jgi:DNA-binding transcriptional MocR family regulator
VATRSTTSWRVFYPHYYISQLPPAASLPNATVVGDFSEALCLPTLRIGWVVDRRRDWLERYRDARMYFTRSNSPITEWLTALAIKKRQAIYGRVRHVSLINLDLIDSVWSSANENLQWIRPDGGFTVFPAIRGVRDTVPCASNWVNTAYSSSRVTVVACHRTFAWGSVMNVSASPTDSSD